MRDWCQPPFLQWFLDPSPQDAGCEKPAWFQSGHEDHDFDVSVRLDGGFVTLTGLSHRGISVVAPNFPVRPSSVAEIDSFLLSESQREEGNLWELSWFCENLLRPNQER